MKQCCMGGLLNRYAPLFLTKGLSLSPAVRSLRKCSGLIELDTSIKDNTVNYWSIYESKTSLQELPTII
jgi:hypothetical protein